MTADDKQTWIQNASVTILAGLLSNPNIIGQNHSTGWNLVNCTPAQIADYAKHLAEQLWWVNNSPSNQD